MKINAIDEYGLRVLLQIAKTQGSDGLSISQLSELEGLSTAYVAKIARTLKAGGLINSTRGHKGGYVLVKDPAEISIKHVLQALGGALYDPTFCASHSGEMKFCNNSVDCSVRSLWKMVQASVDQLLEQVTLQDLLSSEQKSATKMKTLFEKSLN